MNIAAAATAIVGALGAIWAVWRGAKIQGRLRNKTALNDQRERYEGIIATQQREIQRLRRLQSGERRRRRR